MHGHLRYVVRCDVLNIYRGGISKLMSLTKNRFMAALYSPRSRNDFSVVFLISRHSQIASIFPFSPLCRAHCARWEKGAVGANSRLIIAFQELFRVWYLFACDGIKLIASVESKISLNFISLPKYCCTFDLSLIEINENKQRSRGNRSYRWMPEERERTRKSKSDLIARTASEV